MKIVIVIFILFTKFVNAEVIDINIRELNNLIEKKIKIIDVRTENEWKSTGIIKGSFLISLLNENKKLPKLQIYNLTNGINYWIKSGNSVYNYKS